MLRDQTDVLPRLSMATDDLVAMAMACLILDADGQTLSFPFDDLSRLPNGTLQWALEGDNITFVYVLQEATADEVAAPIVEVPDTMTYFTLGLSLIVHKAGNRLTMPPIPAHKFPDGSPALRHDGERIAFFFTERPEDVLGL